MTELLSKKTRKINSIETPLPEKTFSRNTLFTVNEPRIREKKITTTIRCSVNTADEINALAVLLDYENINSILEYAIKKITSELSDSEKRELRSIKSIYSKKRNLKSKNKKQE